MSPDTRKILDQILAMPDGERADLAARIIDSLDQHVDAEAQQDWADEIGRRTRENESGEVQLVPWPELRAHLLGRLNASNAA